MAHRRIIMYGKDERSGGGGPAHAQHREALTAAVEEMSTVAPLFFRSLKAQMIKSIDLPDDLKELGDSQVWVLHALARGKHKASTLARMHNVTNPTMTHIIDSLVKKGYVERRPDAKDRRCIFLELTGQGMDTGKYVEQHFRKVLAQFLNPLTDEQLNDVIKAHRHLGSLLTEGCLGTGHHNNTELTRSVG